MRRAFLLAWALTRCVVSSSGGEASARLHVKPMPASRPALKYQLLPALSELKPGNPAQNYLKCFMEQRFFFYSAKVVADRSRYQTMALADLPLKDLENYGGSALRQADWAARLDTLDWAALEGIQQGSIDALPEELGPLQVLVSALHVRFRAEVAGKRFDDAVRSAQTMFALSRHLGEHPTEVASRLGLWAASVTLGTIEEMVQQPGCPNLYWALTDLPRPLVDVRKGLQGQCLMVAALLRPLRDDAAMAESELDAFVSRLSGVVSFAREQAGRDLRNVRNVIQQKARDPERVRAARGRLVEAGCARERVSNFPPVQVILLDEKRDFSLERDERLKLLGLEFSEIGSFNEESDTGPGTRGLFADLLPDVNKLKQAQGLLEQRIAMLRHVEALRLYAAEHDGDLPGDRCALSVPVPIDPIAGRPLEYAVEASTAHIRGGSFPGVEKRPRQILHYEVTVQRKSKDHP